MSPYETGRAIGSDPDREHYNYQNESFILVIPQGESEDAFKERERREFAERQRDALSEIGASRSTIRAVFKAAGVARSVNGAKLALRTLIACGGNQQAALNLLAEVEAAAYGRERRLARLAEAGVQHDARTANRLNAELRAAVAFGSAHWGLKPRVVQPKKAAVSQSRQPLTHGLMEGWTPQG